jgi:hypothetical protein
MGRGEAARDGETTDQGDGETRVFDDQSRGPHQIGDASVGAVNVLQQDWSFPSSLAWPTDHSP